MIKQMKNHMLQKLETRYTESQKQYLSYWTYLDPRLKNTVNFDMQNFKAEIKEINDSYTEYIPDTQSQTLDSIQTNPTFASPINRQVVAGSSSSGNTRCGEGDMFMDDYSEEDTVRTSDDVTTLISMELGQYAKIQFTREQKENVHVISLWKDRKSEYPYLFRAVKALLCTPATSVPSERVFSEAGYIARARRSRILPVHLNRYLLIKKNMSYLPPLNDYFSEQQAKEGLKAVYEAHLKQI